MKREVLRWSFWEAALQLSPGCHILAVRATDSAGETQPPSLSATWNVKGYNNNAWHRVAIREYPLLEPAPGWQVQDPETILGATASALAECVAAANGAEVLGISLVTNLAAGLGGPALSHDDVLAVGNRSAARMGGLLARIVDHL